MPFKTKINPDNSDFDSTVRRYQSGGRFQNRNLSQARANLAENSEGRQALSEIETDEEYYRLLRGMAENQIEEPENYLTSSQQEEYNREIRKIQKWQRQLQRRVTDAQDLTDEPRTGIVGQEVFPEIWELNQKIKSGQEKLDGIVAGGEDPNLRLKAKKQPVDPTRSNVLNHYMNVQYHISLSMLEEKTARAIQNEVLTDENINLDEMRASVRKDASVTIASTGDTYRTQSIPIDPEVRPPHDQEIKPLEGISHNYYNITSVRIENVYSPSPNNPMISQLTNMKMQINEPHGFKFAEDTYSLAVKLGYQNINVGRVMYRVDIYFSGYDPTSGMWIERISMGNTSRSPSMISYYMTIGQIESNVTATGTEYDITLNPAAHSAYRPEESVFDASHVFSGDSNTFGEFLDNLSEALQEAKLKRTQGEIKRNYKFYAPEFVRQAVFDAKEFGEEKNYIDEKNSGEGNLLTIGKDVDIETMLEAAKANTPLINRLFLAEIGNSRFVEPRVDINIRYNTRYGNSDGAPVVNPELHDYDEITYEYILEPFLTFKKGTVRPDTISDYMAMDSQIDRVREMIKYGMLIRTYNYMFTSENTEVMDLELKLKNFYYELFNARRDNQMRSGISSEEATASVSEERAQEYEHSQVEQNVRVEFGELSDDIAEQTIGELFGSLSPGAPGVSNMGPYDKLRGGFNERPDVSYYSSGGNSGDSLRNDYVNYFDDYLKNDLLTIEGMQTRGDPVWLLSPYANSSLDILELEKDTQEGAQNTQGDNNVRIVPRTGKVIFLKIRMPEQDDFMNPGREKATSYPNLVGGFYEVTTVNSIFEGGMFTQELNAHKMAHLNYAEELFDETQSFGALVPARSSAPTRDQREPQQEEPEEEGFQIPRTPRAAP